MQYYQLHFQLFQFVPVSFIIDYILFIINYIFFNQVVSVPNCISFRGGKYIYIVSEAISASVKQMKTSINKFASRISLKTLDSSEINQLVNPEESACQRKI